jgi:hypothetical protein
MDKNKIMDRQPWKNVIQSGVEINYRQEKKQY